MCNYWTIEEDKRIENNIKNKTYEEMINLFPGRSLYALKQRGGKLKLNNPRRKNKYTKDYNFWNAPTDINSYWAGALAADCSLGNYSNPKYKNAINYSFHLEISEKDLNHLQLLKSTLKYDGPLTFKIKKSPRSDNFYNYWKLSISGVQKWHEDLKKYYNITPRKTFNLKPPNVELLTQTQIKSFIKGNLDGDGSIVIYNSQLSVVFVSASQNFIEWIQDYIKNEYKVPWQMENKKIIKQDTVYRYTVCGYQAAMLIEDLYSIKTPYLARKWEKEGLWDIIKKLKEKKSYLFKHNIYKNYNFNFWTVQNVINSFWAGVLHGRKFLEERAKQNNFFFCLAGKNKNIIDDFIKDIEYIKPKLKINKTKGDFNLIQLEITDLNPKFYSELADNFGCLGKFEKRTPPRLIDDNYIYSFLLGLISVKGGISTVCNQCIVNTGSLSKEVALWLSNWLETKYPYTNYESTKEFTITKSSKDYDLYNLFIRGKRAAHILSDIRKLDLPYLNYRILDEDITRSLEKYGYL